MKIRAVLDTSALIGSLRHELVFTARQGYYTIIWSAFLIAEVTRIRTELAIRHGQDREVYRANVNGCIHELSQLATFVDYTRLEGGNYQHWLKDADDEPVLATALVGKAHYLVSLNTKDFPPSGSFAGIQYITPRAFLDHLYSLRPQKRVTAPFEDSGYRLP